MGTGIIVIGSELLSGKRFDGPLMEVMQCFVVEHPDVRLSCLPHMDGEYRETELGVRAAPQAAQLAHSWLRAALSEAGFAFRDGGR